MSSASESTGFPGAEQHAAMWLVGPDMPGLLNLGASFVADRGGNIDRDIAHKFGENCVIFMSITADPADIARMDREKVELKHFKNCNFKFQPMHAPTIPDGFQEKLYGFDIVTDDRPGLIAEVTKALASYGMLIVGHTGERYVQSGPRPKVQSGQKFVVMIPPGFDQPAFAKRMNEIVKRYNGTVKTPLRTVPGLLWWW